ncbi:hypothetical protein B0J12DRAFT_348228 [Macrophomina phaseolina]|uniref:Uncharacterized protein n=1 Tax=Macrophomina phaseolina TaxID=35725 RepID=A0ABQ8GMK9_9PEZI|nr:hypothetical protein B0J12DRAFT_348228 [Macrophomina phaseolina]
MITEHIIVLTVNTAPPTHSTVYLDRASNIHSPEAHSELFQSPRPTSPPASPETSNTPALPDQRPNLYTTAMQIAEILSDLTSLRVCDPAAALALVSASTTSAPTTSPNSTSAATADSHTPPADENEKDDADLQRARDLLALHAAFKGNGNGAGLAAELRALKEKVGRAVAGQLEEDEGEDGEGFEAWD